MQRASRVAFALALLCGAGLAHANGRFPSLQTAQYQHGGDDLILGATFGGVFSKDGRTDFRWVCEQAIGYGGYFDPVFAENANGVLFGSTFDGLSRSEDGGCTWGFAYGDILGLWIEALDLHPTDPTIVFAASSSGGQTNAIMKSTDSGRSFTTVTGTASPVQFYRSLKFAPSDPLRIYATSYTITPETTTLWKSVNGGQSFATIDFPFHGGNEFKVLAVHPTNPDILIARTQGLTPAVGDPDMIVYRSIDGGLIFTEVFRSTELIGGVAFSNDGQTVTLSTRPSGLQRSTNGGMSFAPVAGTKQVRCVVNHDGTLYGCGNNFSDGFAYASSASFGGAVDWVRVFSFADLKGPVVCPAGALATWLPEPMSTDPKKASRATKELCEPLWATTAVQLGITGVDSGVADAGAADAGVKPPKDPGMCSCQVAARRGRAFGLLAALALLSVLGVLFWRARRSRS
jgi:hypothetical protein